MLGNEQIQQVMFLHSVTNTQRAQTDDSLLSKFMWLTIGLKYKDKGRALES